MHIYIAVFWTFVLDQGLRLNHVQYHKLAIVGMIGEYITVIIVHYRL